MQHASCIGAPPDSHVQPQPTAMKRPALFLLMIASSFVLIGCQSAPPATDAPAAKPPEARPDVPPVTAPPPSSSEPSISTKPTGAAPVPDAKAEPSMSIAEMQMRLAELGYQPGAA